MAEILTSLTEMAVAVFREKKAGGQKPPQWFDPIRSDPVLDAAQRAASINVIERSDFREVMKAIFAEEDFAALRPQEGGLDPMLLHPGGGVRMTSDSIVAGIFSAAFLQMYFLRLSYEEGTYVRSVLENFDELRRALRGERVRAYLITGLAQVTLPEAKQIATPWGNIRPVAPGELPYIEIGKAPTSCILAEQRLFPVVFDRAPSPERKFDPLDARPNHGLLPLACALASADPRKPAVPLITFSTFLLPFQGSFFGYSFAISGPSFNNPTDLSETIAEVENWARIVNSSHVPAVDVAARRLVSAIGHRIDKADALIDAVMVWENLVGTSNEVSFRVTAALAKLLEPDGKKRSSYRKQLSEIYGLRSRVVHGATVDAAAINSASTEAVAVAIQALRASYHRGREWLAMSSTERAEAILLEWE